MPECTEKATHQGDNGVKYCGQHASQAKRSGIGVDALTEGSWGNCQTRTEEVPTAEVTGHEEVIEHE